MGADAGLRVKPEMVKVSPHNIGISPPCSKKFQGFDVIVKNHLQAYRRDADPALTSTAPRYPVALA
jgi:hypothetical protein